MAVDEVGQLLIAGKVTDRMHPGKIIGYLVCTLGKVGVFAGQIITAALSRQREYLADATAVQFTRNSYALAAALDVVRQQEGEPALLGVHGRELAHLCFHSGRAQRWLRDLLATHPDIALRIKSIDPNFDVKKISEKKRSLETVIADDASAVPSLISVDTGDISAGLAPSDRIILLLPDGPACLAALFALFVDNEPNRRRVYLSAMSVSFTEGFIKRVKGVIGVLPDELSNDQVGIIVHASSVLNKCLEIEQRRQVVFKLEQLLNVNGNYHLMDYARVQLIRRMLHIEFPLLSAISKGGNSMAMARKAKSFDCMGQEFALLLSLMVETSGASPDDLDKQFRRVLNCYTQETYPRRTANETGIIKDLEAAFQTLYVQPKPIRHAFVQHCIEIMRHDGHVMPDERALLDLFAASLGCEELIAA